MAPSTKEIEAKLRSAIKETFDDDQDLLTVKYVRNKVEKELDLEEGFFLTSEWKDKSKQFIKEWATKLMDEEEPAQPIEIDSIPKKKVAAPAKNHNSPVKKGTKRGAKEERSQPKKRQKKAVTPSDVSDEETSELSSGVSSEASDASEFGDDSDSDAPKSKKSATSKTKASSKRGSNKETRVVDSDKSEDEDPTEPSVVDSDESSDAASTPPKKKAPPPKKPSSKQQRKSKAKVESDEESDNATPDKDEPSQDELMSSPSAAKNATPKKAIPKKAAPKKESESRPTITNLADPESKANDSDSSQMSVVLDVTPKPKRQRKTKAEVNSSKTSKTKSTKEAKPAKEAKSAKELSPSETQIKTIQSQLVKCGMRKIWGIELKVFGDDNQAKIKHLNGMLKEIGMTGRFSDQRAKEIKELRELQADLAAVKEGESKWGLESGKRARRGAQRKSLRESTDDDDNKSGSEGPVQTPQRERARRELAFLGDDDESDSD